MVDTNSEADVFAVPRLWRTSQWLEDSEETSPGSFFPKVLKDLGSITNTVGPRPKPGDDDFLGLQSQYTGLEGTEDGFLRLAAPVPDTEGFFKIPPLQPQSPVTLPEPSEHVESQESSTVDLESERDPDLWLDLKRPTAQAPTLRTWDGFISGVNSTCRPLYLTEAGATVFDSLLSSSLDPLQLGNSQVPIVDTNAYIAALLSLAVGRESVFFTRTTRSGPFRSILPRMRLSGFSSELLIGLQTRCYDCGSMVLDLRSFTRSTYTKQASRCGVALSSAFESILQIIQHHVDVQAERPRSILQLQSIVYDLGAVLQPLHALMTSFGRDAPDEEILSHVFRHACVMEHKEHFVRNILQEILRVVSLPWIETLEEWIGTRQEDGIPFTKLDVGKSKGFITVQPEICIDDFGHETEDVDFRLDEKKIPEFFPDDLAAVTFETGKNLRFIRSSHPNHALSRMESIFSSQPPKAEWLFEWEGILKLEEKVVAYRDNLEAALSGKTYVKAPQILPQEGLRDSTPRHFLQTFELDGDGLKGVLEASMLQMEAPLDSLIKPDHFTETVKRKILERRSSGNLSSITAPHPSLTTALSFGGLISMQARIVNREALRLLFSSHSLRAHLNMQKSFQLLGNGYFCTRLTHALLDPELETAERQAGVARRGGVMGLRLGHRDTWPPASSELQLSLMGVLSESFEAEYGSHGLGSKRVEGQSSSLPGDLSFAVRDLAPDDIEKCMNPDSLEALDFLRLAYTAPAELKGIITPLILIQYDRIFKHLVRLLRLTYVVDQLFCDVNSRSTHWQEPGNVGFRFAREARHFVSSIAGYSLGTAVEQPWQAFQVQLEKVQSGLENKPSKSDSAEYSSPEEIRLFHSRTVDQIMLGLFLRKRQKSVLLLLEEIFNTILQYATFSRARSLGLTEDTNYGKGSPEQLYRDFKKKVQVFVTVCRSLTEKSRAKRTGRGAADGLGDESMVSQLLLRLDLNNFYTK